MRIQIVDESSISKDTIVALYYLFYKELRSRQGLPSGDISDYRRDIESFLGKGDKFFIALVDNSPAGFVRISEREGAYWIEEIFVRPEFRGRGIGKELVKAAEQYIGARDNAAYIMVLPQDLNAIKFWLHMGYRLLNTIELVKYLRDSPKAEGTRMLEVFGFPLFIWRWREEYDSLESEFLATLEKFFARKSRKDFLKIVMEALKRTLE